jgi:polysaccharide pyruvyl transferase WcaK-like protein
LIRPGDPVSVDLEAGEGERERRAATGGRLACMRRVHRFVGGLDAIVFNGGGLLDDYWGGAWTLPFWVLVWSASARAQDVKVSFHAVGLDRLSGTASRALARTALRLAHHRSFRDTGSLRALEAMGLSAPAEVVPDLAFALEPAASGPPAEAAYVVLNPAHASMWTRRPDASYTSYLDAFVALGRQLLARGLAVRLASTQDAMDNDALAYVAGALRPGPGADCERLRITRLDDLLTLARGARLVVSSRLHGLILAMVAGTPAVSIAPMRKMTTLMAETGLADFDLDASRLDEDRLVATVERALAEEARLRAHVARTVAEYRRRLHDSFDRMFAGGLLGERARRRFDPTTVPRGDQP